MDINSFSLCSSWKVFLSPIVKDGVAGYSNLIWQLMSFRKLGVHFFHTLSAFRLSFEKPAVIQMGLTICGFLVQFYSFQHFLCCICLMFNYILERFFSRSCLINVQNASCIWMAISFIRFVEFSAVNLLNVLSKLLVWNAPLLFHASKMCSFNSISQLFFSVCSYLLFYHCCYIDVHISSSLASRLAILELYPMYWQDFPLNVLFFLQSFSFIKLQLFQAFLPLY